MATLDFKPLGPQKFYYARNGKRSMKTNEKIVCKKEMLWLIVFACAMM